MTSLDGFRSRTTLTVGRKRYEIFSLPVLAKHGFDIARWPFSMRIFLENLLRHEDGRFVKKEDILAVLKRRKGETREVFLMPARVLMQDFTGVPGVVDLAAMRETTKARGFDPAQISPLLPVDLVIDHSLQVDRYGLSDAFDLNTEIEYERNRERYLFLKWGQKAFRNFRVVPPETGIIHQVNLEHLAKVVWTRKTGDAVQAFPDSLVGTDSHTTMINGLGVMGWGVGGIEAEAAMLGQPMTMLVPEVVGFKLKGSLKEGVTATDAVLTATQMLRKKGVVGKFVEFYGPGVSALSLADRATLSNMAPEYGATMGFFPVDGRTIEYLKFTGRGAADIALVEAYCKAQGLFRTDKSPEPDFFDTLELDLGDVAPCISGPKRPQDRIALGDAKASWEKALSEFLKEKDKKGNCPAPMGTEVEVTIRGETARITHGSVTIAAITSCTNTSNPDVLVCAGLLAKNAVKNGLRTKPWVKTSLAPGSKVVTDYLAAAGVQKHLDELGFQLVGYGCATCIGNSGPLPEPVAEAVSSKNLIVASVLSGNRNFEGRVNPLVKANYLASPPLVVAYALAGRMDIDLAKEPLGKGRDGKPVFLKDLWPSNKEIAAAVAKSLTPKMFSKRYADVFAGDKHWKALKPKASELYGWEPDSTYVRMPPYFQDMAAGPGALRDIKSARALLVLGDSVTTDHISPAGNIAKDSPAGLYLQEKGVAPKDFNSYGARRGNHEVMMRGTFANIRLRNAMVDVAGPYTFHLPERKLMSVFEASQLYLSAKTPLVVLAGKEYGSGSSRDWAAKGPSLLGIAAVIAESFERIHRSNLVGMGILPLEFEGGASVKSLGLTGFETFDVLGIGESLEPRGALQVRARSDDGKTAEFRVTTRLDTPVEIDYYRRGGILPYVLSRMLEKKTPSPARPVAA
ncbi:MAG: aconitate hydratase AcnA [Elusimicrobia bacterium]|nr:aconitate hydratase AcnA [Elusimicrobiota bacterium]